MMVAEQVWGRLTDMRSGGGKQGVHSEGANRECPVGHYRNLNSSL